MTTAEFNRRRKVIECQAMSIRIDGVCQRCGTQMTREGLTEEEILVDAVDFYCTNPECGDSPSVDIDTAKTLAEWNRRRERGVSSEDPVALRLTRYECLIIERLLIDDNLMELGLKIRAALTASVILPPVESSRPRGVDSND